MINLTSCSGPPLDFNFMFWSRGFGANLNFNSNPAGLVQTSTSIANPRVCCNPKMTVFGMQFLTGYIRWV